MSGAPCRVVVVVLGDSHTGKTALIRALTTGRLCDPSQPFTPTVGADFLTTQVVYHGRSVELVLWDYGGSERFVPPLGVPSVEAHVCCLVADLTDKSSLGRLTQWRDEFAQASKSLAAPAFVVAGTKADAADLCDGQRQISRSDLDAFAAIEASGCSEAGTSTDPDFRWPRQAAGTATVVPPVFEVSAASQASLDGSIAGLKEALIFRGLVAQAAAMLIQERVSEATAGTISASAAYNLLARELPRSPVTVALHGPATPPASLFPNVQQAGIAELPRSEGAAGRPWNMLLWHTAFAGTAPTPELYRLMRVVVLLVELADQTTAASSIRLLQEDYLRQANLRDADSLVWIVLGVSGHHKAPAASERLAQHCQRQQLPYVEVPWLSSDAGTAELWATLCRAIQDEHVGMLMRRASDQLLVAATACPNGACPWVAARWTWRSI